jgi:tetratricopeptide (TPR) repeat protein
MKIAGSRVFAVLALGVALVSAPAVAQTSGEDGLAARRDALFAQTLQDPTNLDVAFEYAMVSAQLGDYEAAIAALERMLVFAPNLPRVQLELGALYYRIGATDVARAYFEAAQRESVPPEVRARLDTYIAALDRQDNPFLVEGQFTIGGQFQSNANAAPNGGTVIINGIPLELDEDARSQADFNVFNLIALHFSYDLKNQGDLIEAEFVTYNNLYFNEDDLNLDLFELTVGPSFSMGRFGLDAARVGFYGIVGGVALDREGYSTALGVGGSIEAPLSDAALLDHLTEWRALNYLNSEAYPTVREQTGNELRNVTTLSTGIGPRVFLSLTGQSRFVDARADYKSFIEFGGSARAAYLFEGLRSGWFADDQPWQVSLSGGALARDYRDPDPQIDASESEEDRVLWGEIGLSVPFDHDISGFITGQITDQWSNYDTRDYTNGIITVGLTKRF